MYDERTDSIVAAALTGLVSSKCSMTAHTIFMVFRLVRSPDPQARPP